MHQRPRSIFTTQFQVDCKWEHMSTMLLMPSTLTAATPATPSLNPTADSKSSEGLKACTLF